MALDSPRIAVAVAGFCAFLNLYAPQSVLPLFSREFAVGPADASLTITAPTLAIALIAPFTGAVADVVGRKRVISTAMFALVVPTVLTALAPSISALVFWRFVQGLVLPPIFAVTVAYISEEWPRHDVIAVTGLYTSATSFGGFFGRFTTGLLADAINWRAAFLALAALTLVLALVVIFALPVEQHFVRSPGLRVACAQMGRHLRNRRLVATYGIGFGVLFTFIATFTYVNFLLAAPPFELSSTFLGVIFVVYLGGSLIAPLTGAGVARFGRRGLVILGIGIWICGLLLTLVPWLPAIVVGLTISATSGFLCQAVSIGVVAISADEGHSSAVGLYVTCYYVGGSIGGLLPGLAWNVAGWPGCIAMVVIVLLLMALIVWRFWADQRVASSPAGCK
jgi:MFS transporter, YNFM family, putative membrane transport protein